MFRWLDPVGFARKWITVVLPAATFTLAFPEIPVPVRLAVASSCAGQATPVSANFTFATPPDTATVPDTEAAPGTRSSTRWTTPAAWMRA